MRTSNPILKGTAFQSMQSIDSSDVMTVQGTVNKSFILLLLLTFFASMTWKNPMAFAPYFVIAIIAGLVLAIITVFNKPMAPYLAPLYASAEGIILGYISVLMERQFPGIVMQAVGLTFGTLAALLFAYKAKMITVTQKFRLMIVAATGGICLFYLSAMVLGFFGIHIPMIYDSGPIGIGFSLFVVAIAALNLVLDFDMIEQGATQGAPRYMEWYGAFALMVTLIWLYIEILNLLAKLKRR